VTTKRTLPSMKHVMSLTLFEALGMPEPLMTANSPKSV
jgi:hypothetical protein